MHSIGKAAAAAGLWVALLGMPAWAGPVDKTADFGAAAASDEARKLAQWAVTSGDHLGLPFAVVDKREARVFVFKADGKLAGDTVALMGETVGDQSAQDVGEHTQSGFVPMEERTTPAGRFISEPGQNLSGEHVVWVDYSAAFAIHRLRPGASLKAREARLASSSPADKRVSLGCVIVPPPFYEQVVQQVLGHSRAVVYILPESTPVRDVFAAM